MFISNYTFPSPSASSILNASNSSEFLLVRKLYILIENVISTVFLFIKQYIKLVYEAPACHTVHDYHTYVSWRNYVGYVSLKCYISA